MKTNNRIHTLLPFVISLCIAASSHAAWARSLEGAVKSAGGTLTSVAQYSCVIGLAVAAILFGVGMRSWAGRVFTGALIGAVLAFGQEAIRSAVQAVF